jgi:hypothetical protein
MRTRVECTQFADCLGTTCGPPVENHWCMTCEVLMFVTTSMFVFCAVTPCGPVGRYRRFRVIYRCQKMAAVCSCESLESAK